ncbi:TadE/TadG family type IV pilus assembly protein [Falsiroseomonas oryziterrae]|uniref:TadE/TadG family type IV pilus assembly protein n=1 Tax=Falsiroseomonas oryziterrae TaxID=2911368 RepID=UPI001F312853|nr:TadE/TadG family type IV pilus assembly protein [Roseomonas sp. NPKOSM-4]
MRRADRLGRRGVAAVEFALVLPVLLILLLGTVDILTALRAQLRLETAAVQLGQIVSQCGRITDPTGQGNSGDLGQFWSHGQRMIGNLGTITGTGTDGAVIITAVRRRPNTNQNEVAWQRRTGSGNHASSVANAGQQGQPAPANTTATIAAGFVVPPNETLFVTEVTLNRTALLLRGPLVNNALPQQLRGTTLFLSRSPIPGDLQNPPGAATQNDPGGLSCTA